MQFDDEGYIPLRLSTIYWKIKELITLNLLLIVDEIVLDGIDCLDIVIVVE